ncbi:MAG: DUF5309 family protein [Lachnospiraceae bacterium]|nr:DUF5309 family protein [Lachnospiraceae bacterium]
MPKVEGIGTSWNLPNYAGELFTASPKKTPLLSSIGGLTGGKTSNAMEFVCGQEYELPAAAQPEITESASVTAPEATEIAREQKTNTCQIYQETIEITYAKQANSGKLEGLNLGSQSANPANELDFQIARKLEKMATDVEYTFINGSYQKATSAIVAPKTRGLIELCADSTSIDAQESDLTKALLDSFYLELAKNGALWDNMTIYVNAELKQKLTAIYENQYNAQMNMGNRQAGGNILTVETDFGLMNIVYDQFVPAKTLLAADIAHLAPVFNPVPGKGVLFVEDLAKNGAAERKQIYGQIGLDHGMAFMHGAITNLK